MQKNTSPPSRSHSPVSLPSGVLGASEGVEPDGNLNLNFARNALDMDPQSQKSRGRSHSNPCLPVVDARTHSWSVRGKANAMLVILGMAIFTPMLLTAGCQVASNNGLETRATQTLPFMTSEELAEALAEQTDVLLVEFCVPSGCFRCDKMRESIRELASNERKGLAVYRVDIRQQPAVAWELGVTVCPSYIAFRDGEEVFRATYPTSAELIMSGLEESLRESSTNQMTLADR